jgi:hypothetical protein
MNKFDMKSFFARLIGPFVTIWTFLLYFRATTTARLEVLFKKRFGKYPSFPSAYVVLQPYFFRTFVIVVIFPGFIAFLYLFFCWYRFYNWEYDHPNLFSLYGVRINNLVDFFHVYYRHGEVTGFHAYSLFEEIKLRLCIDLLENPRYQDWFSWTPKVISLQDVENTYNRVREHIKSTPYPVRPIFPVVDYVLYLITGDKYYYAPTNWYSRYLIDSWIKFIEGVISTIIKLPYYYWVDRSDFHYYYSWSLRTKHWLFIPTWEYLAWCYYDPFVEYINGWLAFIPRFSIETPGIILLLRAAFDVFKIILQTVFSMRTLVLTASVLIDDLSLYYATNPLKPLVTLITIVYGIPFLIFSYIMVYVSIFFMPARILVTEFILTYVDKLYDILEPIFTTVEGVFSSNEAVSEWSKARILLEISDSWMWFFPIGYVVLVLYVFFLAIAFLWWLLFRPLFFVYSVFYDVYGVARPRVEIKLLLSEQFFLLGKIVKLKFLALGEEVRYVFSTARAAFITSVREKKDDYIISIDRALLLFSLRIIAEAKALDIWDKAQRDAAEEQTEEETLAYAESLVLEREEQERIRSDIDGWSAYGHPPSVAILFQDAGFVSRLVTRPYGYFWIAIAPLGILCREIYSRLFTDGTATNITNTLFGFPESQHIDSNQGSWRDYVLIHDRRIMRYLPMRGGQELYSTLTPNPSSNSFADLLLSTFRWFILFAVVVFLFYGLMWLIFRTFREIVNAYWVFAVFLFVYMVGDVFGEAFGHTLIDYAFPLGGWIEHFITYLDSFSSSSGLTDNYQEMKLRGLEDYIRRNKNSMTAWHGKTGRGWFHPKRWKMYVRLGRQLDMLSDWNMRYDRFVDGAADRFELFVEKFYSNPVSPDLFTHRWKKSVRDIVEAYAAAVSYFDWLGNLRSRQEARFSALLRALDAFELQTGLTFPRLRALLVKLKAGSVFDVVN